MPRCGAVTVWRKNSISRPPSASELLARVKVDIGLPVVLPASPVSAGRVCLSPAVPYVSAPAAQSLTERWQLLRRKEGPEERMYGQHSRSSPPLQGPIQSGWLRRTAQVQCRDAATGWRGVTVFWSRGCALLQGGEDKLVFLWLGGFVAVVPFLFGHSDLRCHYSFCHVHDKRTPA